MSDADYIKKLEEQVAEFEKNNAILADEIQKRKAISDNLAKFANAQWDTFLKLAHKKGKDKNDYLEYLNLPNEVYDDFEKIMDNIKKQKRQLLPIKILNILSTMWSWKVCIINSILYASCIVIPIILAYYLD
jgi:poly-D-alanine transfer protein DltD